MGVPRTSMRSVTTALLAAAGATLIGVRSSLALVFVIACGRVDFDTLARQADASGPAVDTAPPTLGPCAAPVTAPDPLTVTGTTIDFPSFATSQGVADITVTAFDATTGDMLASTTSDGSGNYVLAIHGGSARPLRFELANTQFLTTEQFTGDYVAADVSGYKSPLWNDGGLGAVYGAADVTRNDGSGNLNVQIMTCGGSPIAGATVTLDPPAGALEYLASNAQPTPSATATEAMYGAAVGFNVPPGSVTVTAMAPSATFDPVSVAVTGGEFTDVIVVYARQ